MPSAQVDLWPKLGGIPEHFVMYGGTALALRLGHRESADFDFFSADPFVPTDLARELDWLGPLTINEAAANNLVVTTAGGVNLAFYGALTLQTVAEPTLIDENGLVVASLFDLAGTKAKTILDRSEWKDYVDIATLLRAGLTLPEIVGFAVTIFAQSFEFPIPVFVRALAWFGDGSADEVPDDMKRELEDAVVMTERTTIPFVAPLAESIRP